MTITYSLAPIPKWYIADLVGRPLGAGSMYTYSSLNKTVQKFFYQDAAGTIPWSDPILFDENGSQGPFYGKYDSSNPQDLYYIEVYDVNGVLQWTIDNFDGNPGSGGGGTTTILDLTNLVPNNIFWRAIPSASPVGTTSLKIAPGIHTGLANTASNYGPDIYFYKSNTACTDAITFPTFSVGSTAFVNDLTPQYYCNYTCTAVGSGGEAYKYIQIPICKNVQSIQNTSISITIWARCNSGANTLTLYSAQFFGDGMSASGTVQNPLQALTLTNSWAQYTIKTTIPSISTKVLGACRNDGLFLQLQFPLNAATNIDFIKPCLYLGNVAPTQQFSAIESIEALINSERTGHVIAGYDTAAPYGYLLMDDLTIGSPSSSATSNQLPTGNYLGRDFNTFPLYNLLWNSVSSPTSNSLCPVSGGLGSSAAADFEANKTLTLQKILGRALASAGSGSGLSARTLGSIVGNESVTLTANNIPPLTSEYNYVTNLTGSGVADFTTGTNHAIHNSVNESSPTTPVPILQPTSFLNYFIKL